MQNAPGEAFRSQFLRSRVPTLLEGIMTDWPTAEHWTKDYLNSVCGDQLVEVMSDRDSDPRFEVHCEHHRRSMLFSDLANIAFSDVQSNNTYMVANNRFFATDGGKKLLKDIPLSPDYFDPADTDNKVFLWFGPGGTITPLHYDVVDIVICQVVGSKHFRLFTTDQAPLLYNSVGVFSDVDSEKPDLSRYPLYKYAQAVEFDLHPGEAVFLPQGHWHQVRALDTSISVTLTNIRR